MAEKFSLCESKSQTMNIKIDVTLMVFITKYNFNENQDANIFGKSIISISLMNRSIKYKIHNSYLCWYYSKKPNLETLEKAIYDNEFTLSYDFVEGHGFNLCFSNDTLNDNLCKGFMDLSPT